MHADFSRSQEITPAKPIDQLFQELAAQRAVLRTHEDELFLVWRGEMTIEFRDRRVNLRAGELCVVPRGIEHRTLADVEAHVLIFEPVATRNTGNLVDEKFTAANGVSI